MLKAIEKYKSRYMTPENYPWVADMVRDVEDEIAERYIELPCDADGVPIHVGDMLEYEEYVTHKIKESRVVALEYRVSTEDWLVNCSQWTSPHETRHVKPRTIEDAIRDALRNYATTDMSGDEVIAKYADEIRGMMA